MHQQWIGTPQCRQNKSDNFKLMAERAFVGEKNDIDDDDDDGDDAAAQSSQSNKFILH